MKALSFSTNGTPQPQGSTRVFMVAGRPRITTDNDRLKPWRKAIVNAAWQAIEEHRWEATAEAVAVTLTFRLPRGKTVTRALPTVRPDLDKLIRAVLDSLTTAGVYNDDSQVIRLAVGKFYAAEGTDPGVHVTITELES